MLITYILLAHPEFKDGIIHNYTPLPWERVPRTRFSRDCNVPKLNRYRVFLAEIGNVAQLTSKTIQSGNYFTEALKFPSAHNRYEEKSCPSFSLSVLKKKKKKN